MLGISDNVCEVEVPTAVADRPSHGDDMLLRVLDVAEGPAALNRSCSLGLALRMQAGTATKAQIVLDRRRPGSNR